MYNKEYIKEIEEDLIYLPDILPLGLPGLDVSRRNRFLKENHPEIIDDLNKCYHEIKLEFNKEMGMSIERGGDYLLNLILDWIDVYPQYKNILNLSKSELLKAKLKRKIGDVV